MGIKLNSLSDSIHEKLFRDVTEFRESFGLTINNSTSDQISEEDDALHTSLMMEELEELVSANTLASAADAIVDIVYVCVGREVQYGGYINEMKVFINAFIGVAAMKGIPFIKAWDIVHSSNMSKLCCDTDEFLKSKKYYAGLGVDVEGQSQPNGMIAIKCTKRTIYADQKGFIKEIKSGKVLKSINYVSADAGIKSLIDSM